LAFIGGLQGKRSKAYYPKVMRTDQRPEFTSRVLDQWVYAKGVTLKLIQAGKPTQNAYVESFNGKFRDECLNEHWFIKLAQAWAVIAAWRNDYDRRRSPWDNVDRPHNALDIYRQLNLRQSTE
jgi:transposase InsO family protein